MEKLYAELSAAEKKANSFKDPEAQEKYIESTLTPIQDKIDALKAAMEAYEETRELLEDLDEELLNNNYEDQDLRLGIMEYTIEVNLDIKDQELKLLETLLSGLEDQAYS
jgi:type I site-specific restriction endonuclease